MRPLQHAPVCIGCHRPASCRRWRRLPPVTWRCCPLCNCFNTKYGLSETPLSAGEECYVALDKGAITDQHVLVLPVEHYASSLAAPASTTEEIAR